MSYLASIMGHNNPAIGFNQELVTIKLRLVLIITYILNPIFKLFPD